VREWFGQRDRTILWGLEGMSSLVWEAFPQPEDAPCRGDRDQLTTGNGGTAPPIFFKLYAGVLSAPRPGRHIPGERTHGTD